MGQYFKAVNVTKRELAIPWTLGGGAKLWEWCANRHAGIFPYLLRKSTGQGGGDLMGLAPNSPLAGRWAGDEVYLTGDYDDSNLYEEATNNFRDISEELVAEYNRFIELDELKLGDH